MSTYTQILYQVVFGSSQRTDFLTRTNQHELYSYIAQILVNNKCHPYKVGGYKNHIHIIFSLHNTIALADLIKDIKMASTAFLKSNKDKFSNFPGWQKGYGAFTYSENAADSLIDYVENQYEHHRNKTFKEELVKFLKEHHIDYNEEYLFV